MDSMKIGMTPTKFPSKVALKKPAGKSASTKRKAPKKGSGRR